MKKIVAAAIKKLRTARLYSLSASEFHAYFEHRISSILSTKLALVRNELEYLLCETGPGNLRTDPEFLPLITSKKTFVAPNPVYANLDKLITQKTILETYISENINSAETQTLLYNTISPYLENARIISIEPFIISGDFTGIPVYCLVQNGKWTLPDIELFSFLQKCQHDQKFPVVISKKISGILFPVFKTISVLGLSTYKIFLPQKGQQLIDDIPQIQPTDIQHIEDSTPKAKYCNQFYFPNTSTSQEEIPTSKHTNLIPSFFSTTLSKNISDYAAAFNHSKITIRDNFLDTISQFKKNKPNKSLLALYLRRQKLLHDLKIPGMRENH